MIRLLQSDTKMYPLQSLKVLMASSPVQPDPGAPKLMQSSPDGHTLDS